MAKLPTARHGTPKPTGRGERQLDGERTTTFSQPVRKGGIAAREAVPDRASDSGLERSMQAHADKEHPC